MESILLQTNAKINLGLHVLGKKENGYHEIETLFLPAPIYDNVFMQKKEGNDFEIEMPGFPESIAWEDNICTKAFFALKKKFPFEGGLKVVINKSIPSGAGLGGGSSNAAMVLSGVNDLYNLGLGKPQLATIGGKLGADVPFFIFNETMIARGVGDVLQHFQLEVKYKLKIVTPGIHSSTIEAYQQLKPEDYYSGPPLREILSSNPLDWKRDLKNSLEIPVFKKYPELANIKQKLYDEGAFYASMSGSGSAIFGLY